MQLSPKTIGPFLHGWHKRRQMARTDLLFLCNEVLGFRDVSQMVHGPIIDAAQKFPGWVEYHKTVEDFIAATNGKLMGHPICEMKDLPRLEIEVDIPNDRIIVTGIDGRKTIILFPRGHLKSSVLTVAHSVQWILNYPNVRILITTATEDLARDFLMAIKSAFISNETMKALFPEYCSEGELGSGERFTIRCRNDGDKRYGQGGKEPTVRTSTVGSAITGYHGDVQICDDMVEKQNSSTPRGIGDVIYHFGNMGPLLETYATESGPKRGWVYVVGTPWDFSDLYSVIQDGEAKLPPERSTWNIVKRSAAPNWPKGPFLWPERVDYKALKEIEDDPTKGPAHLCTPAYSPVLMADWSEKPISEVKVGDAVMGFSRDDSRFRGKMRLVPTKVTKAHSLGLAPLQKMFTTGEREVICTPEHKWFTGRYASEKEPHRKLYSPARIGFELTSVVAPLRDLTPDQQRWMDWLGGIIDGEGSCQEGNTIFISQSPDADPLVCDMLVECFTALGYDWTQYDREASTKWDRNSQRARQWMLRGGRKMMREIYVRARMAKGERIYKTIMAKAMLSEKEAVGGTVRRIEKIDPDNVYALTTETGNYVVWGYASSNSAQYLMNPIVAGQGLIEDISQVIFTPDKLMQEIAPRLSLYAALDLSGMDPESKGTDNDYTCLTVGGFNRDGRLYIPYILHGRPTVDEVIEWIFSVFAKFPGIIKLKMEKEAHLRVLLPFLRKEMARRNKYLSIDPQPRNNQQSKKDKIRGLRSWFVGGDIRFSDALPCRTHLLQEIKGFPKYRHDDILDTLCDIMFEGRDINLGVMGREKAEIEKAEVNYLANPTPLKAMAMRMEHIFGQNTRDSEKEGHNYFTGW